MKLLCWGGCGPDTLSSGEHQIFNRVTEITDQTDIQKDLEMMTAFSKEVEADLVVIVRLVRFQPAYKSWNRLPTVCLTPAQSQVEHIDYWSNLINQALERHQINSKQKTS